MRGQFQRGIKRRQGHAPTMTIRVGADHLALPRSKIPNSRERSIIRCTDEAGLVAAICFIHMLPRAVMV